MVDLLTLRRLGLASATAIALGLPPSLAAAEGTSTSVLTGEQSAGVETVLLDEMNLAPVIDEATDPLKAVDWSGLLDLGGKPGGETAKVGGPDAAETAKGSFFRDLVERARSMRLQPSQGDGDL